MEMFLQLFKTDEKISEDLSQVPMQHVALSEFYKKHCSKIVFEMDFFYMNYLSSDNKQLSSDL